MKKLPLIFFTLLAVILLLKINKKNNIEEAKPNISATLAVLHILDNQNYWVFREKTVNKNMRIANFISDSLLVSVQLLKEVPYIQNAGDYV